MYTCLSLIHIWKCRSDTLFFLLWVQATVWRVRVRASVRLWRNAGLVTETQPSSEEKLEGDWKRRHRPWPLLPSAPAPLRLIVCPSLINFGDLLILPAFLQSKDTDSYPSASINYCCVFDFKNVYKLINSTWFFFVFCFLNLFVLSFAFCWDSLVKSRSCRPTV